MKIKGSNVITLRDFVIDKFGERGFTRLLQVLPNASKKIFEEDRITNIWYDFYDAFLTPLETLCEQFFHDSPQGAFEYGNYSAHHDLRGIYGAFFRLGSPAWTISKTALIWRLYYSEGTVEVTKKNDHHVTFLFHGLENERISQPWEQQNAGWMLGAAEVIGVKNPTIEITHSQAKGAGKPEFSLSWDPK
jgi:hypothetical protein